MQSLKIILLCVVAAIVYGICHDQVTARVCVEYFTVGHKRIFPTESPTLLALGFGIVATWWVGAILGVAAALASRAGSWPKLEVGHLIRPLACLLTVMAVASILALVTGYQLGHGGGFVLPETVGIAGCRRSTPLVFRRFPGTPGRLRSGRHRRNDDLRWGAASALPCRSGRGFSG